MTAKPDLLDRRQRVAAAILLAAVDLPVEALAFCELWLEAAKVCPGITTGEVWAAKGRRAGLEQARALIDDMLAELAQATP